MGIGSSYKKIFPAILLIVVIGIVAYANSFQAPFAMDDNWTIVDNPVIRSLDNFYANPKGYRFLPNRYVATLSLALNYKYGGLDVTGYHIVNLVIHLLSALLVYTLLRLTFRTPYFKAQVESDSGSGLGSTSTWFSSLSSPPFFLPLFAALLFVVHPVQTQAVTYIVQRMTSLAAMFYLLSCVLYVLARLSMESTVNKQQDHGGKTRSILSLTSFASKACYLIGSVAAAVLAMKTKEIAFTLPFAVLLYEVCFFRGALAKEFALPAADFCNLADHPDDDSRFRWI